MSKAIEYRQDLCDGAPILQIRLIRGGSEFIPETKIEELINELSSTIRGELFLYSREWHIFRLDVYFQDHEYYLGIFRDDLTEITESKFFGQKIDKLVNKFMKDLVSYIMKKWGMQHNEVN